MKNILFAIVIVLLAVICITAGSIILNHEKEKPDAGTVPSSTQNSEVIPDDVPVSEEPVITDEHTEEPVILEVTEIEKESENNETIQESDNTENENQVHVIENNGDLEIIIEEGEETFGE